MQHHYRVHRADEVKCGQCGKSFKSSAKLSNHISLAHSGNQTCDVCYKTFGHASSLNRHVKQEHNKVGEKICHHCSKTFRSDNLKIHVKSCKQASEQVVEACHQKLDKIWQWYCVKNVESEIHGENFEACINDFNSMNM